ncbi:MAG: hypothetical protein AAFR38_00445 [Planctomycetota bacterium]
MPGIASINAGANAIQAAAPQPANQNRSLETDNQPPAAQPVVRENDSFSFSAEAFAAASASGVGVSNDDY